MDGKKPRRRVNVDFLSPYSAQAVSSPAVDLLYRVPDQPSLDGNTVDMDRERTQFADNSLKYQMGLTVLGSQLKGMMNVLQGGN
ncbi:flagellar basal-body rod protein FlgB [Salmonella enterica subsp. enterica serovar Typhimurium]|nr:flagellar basal-body rod protein FlgB [Salmonella enterica subsp. enterica serovar Typhimurium]